MLQEEVNGPWQILVVCILLNRGKASTAREVLPELFRRWPTAVQMSGAEPDRVAEVILRCGFQNRRADLLVRMSCGYLAGENIERLPGVGRYALDSLAIFVKGRTDVEPEDLALRAYLDERRRGGQGR